MERRCRVSPIACLATTVLVMRERRARPVMCALVFGNQSHGPCDFAMPFIIYRAPPSFILYDRSEGRSFLFTIILPKAAIHLPNGSETEGRNSFPSDWQFIKRDY